MRRAPKIVAPVSRFLSVADVDRSIAFFRDVLGFRARDQVVEAGPARIELVTTDTAPDSTGAPRSRGSAILFFETDDVVAFRDAILALGGKPSELEKVNWIKMRVFQIQDPDTHTLWFGQSFQEPDLAQDPRRQLQQLLPELPLSDVPAGIAYYQCVLGFKINYAQNDFGVMYRDDVTLLLIDRAMGPARFSRARSRGKPDHIRPAIRVTPGDPSWRRRLDCCAAWAQLTGFPSRSLGNHVAACASEVACGGRPGFGCLCQAPDGRRGRWSVCRSLPGARVHLVQGAGTGRR
jgi:catechol 2,3-dioxygenase-like lactoylglutathione lyase family enzyme